MNIEKVLEQNEKRIFEKMYPDSEASEILCNEYGYGYEYAKKKWIQYNIERGLLFNLFNF